MRYALLLLLLATGCGSPCKGYYTERDSSGTLKAYNEHQVQGLGCVKDTVALGQWELTSEARLKAGVSCKPQSTNRTLVAANNFYEYRNSRLYLDLNASTGEYRRLTLAEGKDGTQLYTRLQGCYFERGGQIMLDTTNAASDQVLDPIEIFTYGSMSPTTIEMVRFDDSVDWDYRFCPYLDTPNGYCDLLRNGNDMFYPNLSAADKASALNDAILIRRQFNWNTTSSGAFESLWAGQDRIIKIREDYKYAVQAIVDEPRYVSSAWADYLRGNRPTMPDITSNRMPPICYPSRRTVTLADGTTSRIDGEVCYVDGQYVFTQ